MDTKGKMYMAQSLEVEDGAEWTDLYISAHQLNLLGDSSPGFIKAYYYEEVTGEKRHVMIRKSTIKNIVYSETKSE